MSISALIINIFTVRLWFRPTGDIFLETLDTGFFWENRESPKSAVHGNVYAKGLYTDLI